eukprot:7277752-Heterocapsa_arctica.AAC.1
MGIGVLHLTGHPLKCGNFSAFQHVWCAHCSMQYSGCDDGPGEGGCEPAVCCNIPALPCPAS